MKQYSMFNLYVTQYIRGFNYTYSFLLGQLVIPCPIGFNNIELHWSLLLWKNVI